MFNVFWQIVATKDAKPKIAFFMPGGMRMWNLMPMGLLNAHAVFVAMMAKLKEKWDKLSRCYHPMKGREGEYRSKVIVDDILLHATTIILLLHYLRCVLITLQHHRCTLKLKKCNFLVDIV